MILRGIRGVALASLVLGGPAFGNEPGEDALPAVEEAAVWIASPGGTLHTELMSWATRAGWQLDWKAEADYPIEFSAELRGDFPGAAARLVGGFWAARPAPRVAFMSGNRVVVVYTGGGMR